ncbi:MAG: SDR family NAD(P)-dependent oxidoreductase [Thermomicrobiales bacterium]
MGSRRFEGKVAIVTGGTRGIGRGIALELAGEGAAVVVNHVRAKERANDVVEAITKAGGAAVAVRADVGRRDEAEALVAAAVDRFGRLDVLVNNAGICPFRPFWEITDEVWEETMRTNLYGAFVTSQAAARVMRDQGGGAIVHVSSVSSYIGGPEQVHYCATKGGINAMTAAMAVALGEHHIRVNAVLPGGVPTDINRHHWEDRPWTNPGLPINRPGQPWDIARAVCYLASDDAAWLTGVLLPVDGGLTVRP